MKSSTRLMKTHQQIQLQVVELIWPNAKHPLTKSHNKYKKDNEKETEDF